jgi:hypothetical protein
VAHLTVRIKARHSYAQPWLIAIAKGLNRHGVEILAGDGPCDLYVIWSHNEHRIIAQQRAAGADYLVAECGYIDRFNHASLGFNGLNGLAEFHNSNVPDDRAQQWQQLLQPLHGGDYTLIVGQCPGDASLRGLNITEWVNNTANIYGGTVYYRPHPLAPTAIANAPTLDGSLDDALAGAHTVAVYNSNVAVDAILHGCGVDHYDRGSMGWGMTDRKEWLRKLAYCQWSLTEIAAGEAWAHLKQRYA